MNEKTRSEYLKLADHFIKTRLRGEQPTLKRVSKALNACASEYRPAYWRRLRIALATHQEANGYRENAHHVRAIKNPVTASGELSDIKKKQYRVKRVRESDADRIFSAVNGEALPQVSRDPLLASAVYICREFGVRPAELFSLKVQGNRLDVLGAKIRKDRGADRSIQFHSSMYQDVLNAVETLQEHDDVTVKALQDRLRKVCRKLWPRRKAVPSLYSFRHQLGSDLKSDSGYDRKEIAYLMGHQSTASVDQYGNRRTGGRTRNIAAASNANMSNIREKHFDFDNVTEKNFRFADQAKSRQNQRDTSKNKELRGIAKFLSVDRGLDL